jgi:hypothetical protein
MRGSWIWRDRNQTTSRDPSMSPTPHLTDQVDTHSFAQTNRTRWANGRLTKGGVISALVHIIPYRYATRKKQMISTEKGNGM